MDQQAPLTILELFPPGRCRRIVAYLARYREQLDDVQKCGQLVLHLGTNGQNQGVVSTSGPQWKPEVVEE